MRLANRIFAVTAVVLMGAGCATSDSPSAQPGGGDEQKRVTLDCLTQARRMTPGVAGAGPQITIDQDRYQRCLAERRQAAPAPTR